MEAQSVWMLVSAPRQPSSQERQIASWKSRCRRLLLHPVPLPTSTAVFCFDWMTDNLAQEVTRGMREAAIRGFWVSTYAPFGYRKVSVQDGAKKRPKLELDSPADAVVRRIFQMAL